MQLNDSLSIDDAIVIGSINDIDLVKPIQIFKYLKSSKLPQKDLVSHFGSLIRSNALSENLLFRRREGEESPKQEFWQLKFLDESERHVFNHLGIKFKSFDFNDIKKIVSFSQDKRFYENILTYLHGKGINLIIVDTLPGTKIDGAAYLTSSQTVSIGLSLRYDRLDYFFFTLLHELAHVVLHTDQLAKGIISEESSAESIEIEANRMAKESIISPSEYRVCRPKRTLKNEDLIACAKKMSIHPAMLAGIIRKDLMRYDVFSDVINSSPIRGSIYG